MPKQKADPQASLGGDLLVEIDAVLKFLEAGAFDPHMDAPTHHHDRTKVFVLVCLHLLVDAPPLTHETYTTHLKYLHARLNQGKAPNLRRDDRPLLIIENPRFAELQILQKLADSSDAIEGALVMNTGEGTFVKNISKFLNALFRHAKESAPNLGDASPLRVVGSKKKSPKKWRLSREPKPKSKKPKPKSNSPTAEIAAISSILMDGASASSLPQESMEIHHRSPTSMSEVGLNRTLEELQRQINEAHDTGHAIFYGKRYALAAYGEALEATEQRLCVTSTPDSEFWRGTLDSNIIQLNRALGERIRGNGGTAIRYLIVDESLGAYIEKQIQLARRAASLFDDNLPFKRLSQSISNLGYLARHVQTATIARRDVPTPSINELDITSSELALYDDKRFDRFVVNSAGYIESVEIHLKMHKAFSTIHEHLLVFFDLLSRKAIPLPSMEQYSKKVQNAMKKYSSLKVSDR